MISRNADDTPNQILVVHEEGAEVAARRVRKNLASLDHPISLRNDRWGYDRQWYMIVIVLGDESHKEGNLIEYNLEEHREALREAPEVKYRSISNREKEKALGDKITQRIMSDLKGAV